MRDVAKRHKKGQPVLLGTASVESSEIVSSLLDVANIPHQVLNAKQHDKEAAVVAVAGRKGAVTVATNMAGRGTDIMLGGNVEFLADAKLKSEGYSPEDTPEEYEKLQPGDDAMHLLHLDEPLLEINITPDRGYAFSYRGMSREYHHSTGAAYTDPAVA